MRAWMVAALLLMTLGSGCIDLRSGGGSLPRGPMLEPALAVQGVAENFVGCWPSGEPMPPQDPGVCHEVLLRMAVPAGSAELPSGQGWTGTTASGGVYAGHLVVGPEGVIGGAVARLRVAFVVDDGDRLASVGWTHGNLTASAPITAYTDLAEIGPIVTLVRAERALSCDDWRCTDVTLQVDNTARDAPFPPPEMRWVVRSAWGLGDAGITATGEVPAGASGPLLLRAPWLPLADVGFVLDGWTLRAFTLPDWQDLPVRDDGERLDVLGLGALGMPQRDANGTTVMPVVLTPTTFSGQCAPFAGRLELLLDWQPGPYIAEALWQERRAWTLEATPADFDDEGVWCSRMLEVPQDAPIAADGHYRLRVTATPSATGTPVGAETIYAM